MSTRLLAFAFLAGVSAAVAVPPQSPPQQDPANATQPADAIDVDALARSKDVGGATPAPEDAPAPATQDLAQPPPLSSNAAPPAESPPPAESAPPEAPVAESPSAEPPAEMVAEPAATASAAAPSIPAEPAPAGDTPAALSREPSKAPPSESSEKISIAASCESRASSLLDEAQKADYGNVTRDFDAKMRTDMPPAKFKQQWESLGQFGKLVARGQSHLGSGEGYTLVMIPLIFEKTNLVAQIACGSDGRIAGFHVTQAPKPNF